jgi:hypothetical protein
VYLKSKLLRRAKGHLILIKGAIHQDEITNIHSNMPNVDAPNFIKHALMNLKIQIDSNIVVVREFNTPLSPIDKSSRQKSMKKF